MITPHLGKVYTSFFAGILTTVIVGGLAACDDGTPTSNPQKDGQKLTAQAYAQQAAAVPYPVSQLTDSLERRNVRERLLRTNKPNATGYVYLLSMTGGYIGYYVVKGKVSSTQSQMTADQLIQPCSQGGDSGSGNCAAVVNAPGDDGSYGANEPGIYFFTSDGTMVTTSMPFIVSDQPLPVNAPKLNPAKA